MELCQIQTPFNFATRKSHNPQGSHLGLQFVKNAAQQVLKETFLLPVASNLLKHLKSYILLLKSKKARDFCLLFQRAVPLIILLSHFKPTLIFEFKGK